MTKRDCDTCDLPLIEEYEPRQGFKIFGKDVSEIKCFRDSFYYGITCGVFGGLLCFMFTSRAALSSQVAFGSTWAVFIGYWFPCRLKYENELIKVEHFKNEVNNAIKQEQEAASKK